MSRDLGMKDPRCASSFLSNMVGNQIKRNVDYVNCDSYVTDDLQGSLNSDRMHITKQQSVR